MGYGGGYGGAGITETVRLAVESAGQGDVQQLIDLFSQLKAKQTEIDAAYREATAAAGKHAAAMKAEAAAGYEVIDSYEILEDAIGRARTAAEKEAAATLWMERQAKAFSDTLEQLAEHERTAERATIDLTAAQTKAGNATKDAGDKAGGYGAMKWLLLSNAIQDVQYGIGAVANNIPQVAMAFGGSAGLAGALQIAAVGLQIVLSKAQAIKDYFGQGDGLFGTFPADVEGLKKKLEELSSKQNKVSIDFMDIDILKDKIKEATEAEREFQALADKKTKAQVAAGKQATEAIVEQAGRGDDVAGAVNLTNLLKQIIPVVVSQAEVDAEEKARVAREYARSGIPQRTGGANGLAVALEQQAAAEKALQSIRDTNKQTRDSNIEKIITGAGRGEETQIQKLLELVKGSPAEARERLGIGPKFVEELEKATRGTINADLASKEQKKADDAKEKVRKENDSEIAKEFDASAAETGRMVREAVQGLRRGIADELAHQLQAMLAAGETDDAARAKVRPGVIARLKERGTPWQAVSAAADELIDAASDEARNRLDTDTPSNLDRKKTQAQAKAEAEDKRKRAERDRRVAHVVTRLGPGYSDQEEAGLFEAAGRGGEPEVDRAMGTERPRLRAELLRRGVDEAMVDDVAGSILDAAKDKALNHVANGTKPAEIGREDKARTAEMAKVEKGFLPQMQAIIAANEAARAMGAPEPRNGREEQQFALAGQAYALPEDVLHNRLGRQAAQFLGASGRDPEMANDLVHKADANYRDLYGRMFGQTGNAMQAALGVAQQTQANVMQVQATLGNVMGQVAGLQAGNAQLQRNNAALQRGMQRQGMRQRANAMQGPQLLAPHF